MGRSVLFVDDSPLAANVADTSETRFDLIEVQSTGDEALISLRERSFDCLIITYPFPNLDLSTFLAAVDDSEPELPVLLLTDVALTDLSDEIDLTAIADVRSRQRVADDPAYLFAALDRILGQTWSGTDKSDTNPLTTLFQTHTLPMLLINPDTGEIAGANDAAVAFYRYSRDSLTSMTIQDINTLDDEAVAQKRREATTSDGSQFVFPHRLRTGEIRTVEVNATPITYEGQQLLFSIVQDITERVEAQDALQYARDRYQRLAEQNIVGIYTIEDRAFTYVNPKMAEIFGTTPEAMIGTSVFEYVDDVDRDPVRSKLEAREEGTVETSHYTFAGVHPEQERLIVEAHGSRVETDDGVTIIGTMLDITDRDSYERELRRLSQALEYAAPAIYITDSDGVIEYVNPAYEQITGYAESEALGETPRLIRSGQMDDDYYQRLYATLEAGNVWEESIINRRKNGEFYHAYQTIAPYKNDADEIQGYVAIQSDVTDIEIRTQVLAVFQRIFRHNLRNKLNVVRGYTDLIEPEVTGTPLAEYVDQIEEAALTLQSLAEKATVVADAIDERKVSTQTDVIGILRREQQTIQEQYPDVRISLDGPAELSVVGDGGVTIALHELIQNAIDHCDHDLPEVAILVSVDESASIAHITISDNGPGLDELEMTTLEVGTETQLIHGSGIGLWLVKWAIISVGGDVAFKNTEPGLEVTVSLPLA